MSYLEIVALRPESVDSADKICPSLVGMSRRVLSGAVPRLARDAARAALDPFVRTLARELIGDSSGLDAAARLLAAVQRRVRFEHESRETFRSPKATWLRGAGDCDDSAVLVAALASAAGLPAELVPMGAGGEPTHVAARILGEWAETTIPGALLGEHPSAALARLGASSGARARRGMLGAVSSAFVARATYARDTIRAAWKLATGSEPTRFELLYGIVWSKIDGSWGRWPPPCDASHNWGAVHAVGDQPGCEWVDHYADNTAYAQKMRVYPNDLEGARDFVRQLVVTRQKVAAALRRVEPMREVARAMLETNYFGGFCPKATGAGHGVKSEACKEEALDLTAGRQRLEARDITAALGWPMPRVVASDAPVAWYGGGRARSGGGGGFLLLAALGAGAYYAHQKGVF